MFSYIYYFYYLHRLICCCWCYKGGIFAIMFTAVRNYKRTQWKMLSTKYVAKEHKQRHEKKNVSHFLSYFVFVVTKAEQALIYRCQTHPVIAFAPSLFPPYFRILPLIHQLNGIHFCWWCSTVVIIYYMSYDFPSFSHSLAHAFLLTLSLYAALLSCILLYMLYIYVLLLLLLLFLYSTSSCILNTYNFFMWPVYSFMKNDRFVILYGKTFLRTSLPVLHTYIFFCPRLFSRCVFFFSFVSR